MKKMGEFCSSHPNGTLKSGKLGSKATISASGGSQWRQKVDTALERNSGKQNPLIPSKRVNEFDALNFNSNGADPMRFCLMDEEDLVDIQGLSVEAEFQPCRSP